jgi:ATP-dependent Lon protease
VILPKRNEQDLDDVAEEIKNTMKFVFVETVDEVLDSALETKRKTARAKQTKQTSKKKATPRKTSANGKSAARGR